MKLYVDKIIPTNSERGFERLSRFLWLGLEHIFEGHTDLTSGVAVTLDGKCAISTSWDGTLRLWDLATRKCRLTLAGDVGLFGVALGSSGTKIVASDMNGAVHFIDLMNM